MQFRIKTLWAVFIFASIAPLPLLGQNSTARFLYYRPNAVSSAMGGIGTAYFHDANAAYFNPAGLAFSPALTFTGSFDHPLPIFPADANSFIAASANLFDIFAIGLSANLYWKGDEYSELNSQVYHPENLFDSQIKLSLAYQLNGNIGVGASVSLLEYTLTDMGFVGGSGSGKSSSVMIDLGVLGTSFFPEATISPSLSGIRLPFDELIDHGTQRGLSIGASLLNLGSKISFIDPAQSDPPPTTLLIGATYYPVQTPLVGVMVGVDAEKRLYDGGTLSYLHYGSELTFLQFIALRAGYSRGTASGENSFFTFGGGVRLKYFSLNFARYVQAILPTWQFDGTFTLEM
jgi:hypothetical protein